MGGTRKTSSVLILAVFLASSFATSSIVSYSSAAAPASGALGLLGEAASTASSPSLQIDGSSSSKCASAISCSAKLTTSSPNDLIIVVDGVGAGEPTFIAPSDTAGLGFSLRAAETAGTSNGQGQALAEYYAISSAALSDTITCKISGPAANMDCFVFAISGANTSSPFDSSSALPSKSTSRANQVSSLSTQITTTNANDMLLLLANIQGNPSITQPSAFTAVGSYSNGPVTAASYEIVSSAQSRLAVGYSLGTTEKISLIADAIQAAGSTSSPWVDLHGVNYAWGALGIQCCANPPNTDFPIMRNLGFNLLRVPISWNTYENNPSAYIGYLNDVASEADSLGMHVVYDAHTQGGGMEPGYFFPASLSSQYGTDSTFLLNWWEGKVTYDGLSGWNALWTDFWIPVINTVNSHPSTLGYELENEPQPSGAPLSDLQAFNQYIASNIQKVASGKYIAFMGPNVGLVPSSIEQVAPTGINNLVIDAHCYIGTNGHPDACAENGGMDNIFGNLSNVAKSIGAKVWIGEWAVCSPPGCTVSQSQAPSIISEYVNEFQKYGFADTYWAWKSDINPATVGQLNLLLPYPRMTPYWLDTDIQQGETSLDPAFSNPTFQNTQLSSANGSISSSGSSNPFAIDHSARNKCASSTSCSVSLTTTYSPDVILVVVSIDSSSTITPKVSDSAVLSWTQRASVRGSNQQNLFEFYAIAPDSLSKDSIKASIASAKSISLLAFAVSGANTSSPFDPDSALPATNYGVGTLASSSISTSNSNDMLLGLVYAGAGPTIVSGHGFTTIGKGSVVNPVVYAEFQVVSSSQSSLSAKATFSTSQGWAMIGDALIAASGSSGGGTTTVCSSAPNEYSVGGIYPASSGAYVEDFISGNLLFCSGGTSAKIIATPPSGASGYEDYYNAMAGVSSGTSGLVLALASDNQQGFWLCYNASTSGCVTKSSFISLPSGFCSSEAQGQCFIAGIALDSSLNFYYTDNYNAQIVECTATSNYKSCSVLPPSNAFSGGGHYPFGLYLDGSTFYVTDNSCTGTVWQGTSSSLSVIGKVGGAITGVTVSSNNPSHSPHVYVAYNSCDDPFPNHIYDLTSGKALPSIFNNEVIGGVDSSLQFTEFDAGTAYQVNEIS